jgi:hypothetical protein
MTGVTGKGEEILGIPVAWRQSDAMGISFGFKNKEGRGSVQYELIWEIPDKDLFISEIRAMSWESG